MELRELHYYTAYGYSFQSDFILSEFLDIAPCRSEIHISRVLEEHSSENNNCELVQAKQIAHGVSFDWDAIGRYEICSGRTIRVIPRKNTTQEIARVPLFGLALAAVLQQNNLLVLHGSSVEINGSALIILGEKGFGKSTLTAALLRRGHRLISDDLVAISVDFPKIKLLPGIPILKLWPDTIREVGFDIDKSRLYYNGISKRLCLLKEQFCNDILPIGAICVLGYGDELKLRNIEAIQRFLHLSSFHYFAHFHWAFDFARHAIIFEQNRIVTKNIEMYELIRFWDLRALDHTSKMIEGLFS